MQDCNNARRHVVGWARNTLAQAGSKGLRHVFKSPPPLLSKDTLDEANNDAQHLVLDRMRKRDMYVERLANVFHAIIEQDGQDKNVLTEKRLEEILEDKKVKAYFSTLEIDVQESAALFNLLDNGDGMVTLEEFINGIMRCKGPARAIDTFALHSDVKQLDAKLRALMRMNHLGQGNLAAVASIG